MHPTTQTWLLVVCAVAMMVSTFANWNSMNRTHNTMRDMARLLANSCQLKP